MDINIWNSKSEYKTQEPGNDVTIFIFLFSSPCFALTQWHCGSRSIPKKPWTMRPWACLRGNELKPIQNEKWARGRSLHTNFPPLAFLKSLSSQPRITGEPSVLTDNTLRIYNAKQKLPACVCCHASMERREMNFKKRKNGNNSEAVGKLLKTLPHHWLVFQMNLYYFSCVIIF